MQVLIASHKTIINQDQNHKHRSGSTFLNDDPAEGLDVLQGHQLLGRAAGLVVGDLFDRVVNALFAYESAPGLVALAVTIELPVSGLASLRAVRPLLALAARHSLRGAFKAVGAVLPRAHLEQISKQ